LTGCNTREQVLAVLRIQWLSLQNSLRRRSERLGLVISALVALFWYGMWLAGAAGLFAFAVLTSDQRLARVLPALLFLVLLYWQLSPLLTASMGMSIDIRKMALYPIGVDTLFIVECLLRLMNGLEMVLLLVGLSAGIATRRQPQTWPIFAALALFILFNVLLSAGLRQLLERMLQRRGLREAFLLLVVTASVMPQLIIWSGEATRVGRQISRLFQLLPHSLLPTTAMVQAYLGAMQSGNWLVLLGWCAVTLAFGMVQFRRSFRFDTRAARTELLVSGQEAATWADRLYQVPSRLLPDPLAAMVGKELRYVLRSPRFRFLFLMGCSFGVVVWLPFAIRRGAPVGGPVQSSFLALVSLYALMLLGQVTFLNSFGFDRSAARYFFWMPVSPAQLLVAKNLVAGFFVALQVLVLGFICFLLGVLTAPWQLLEALAVAGIASLYMASAGNVTSVLFAAGISPERISRAGGGRGVQGLLALLYPVLIAPLLAAYFARYYWHTLQGYFLLLGIALFGAAALYSATLSLAARLAWVKREHLLTDLTRGEGPLVTE
jgi:ABC-2 type transport system permease protein